MTTERSATRTWTGSPRTIWRRKLSFSLEGQRPCLYIACPNIMHILWTFWSIRAVYRYLSTLTDRLGLESNNGILFQCSGALQQFN